MGSHTRTRPVGVIGLLVLALAAAGLAALPAGAYPGAPWFEPGKPYDQNFPDPAIIEVDGTYYAYATTTGGSSLPVMTSTDLRTWTARGDALGAGPSWSPKNSAGETSQWAPTVVELPDGSFLAAFAARTGSGDRRCIATAHATSPLGPFVSSSSVPFLCEPDPLGAIDPFLVVDDGVPWLVWKNEGVPLGVPGMASRRTAFWSRQLADDGRSWRPGSSVHFLLETTEVVRPWQGTVIENPALIRHDGAWVLFYSANEWESAAYTTGFARCTGPGGPCVEPTFHPIATSDAERLGPGAPAPFHGPGGELLVGYHGWNLPFTSYPSYPACADSNGECVGQGQRFLFIDRACIGPTFGFLFDDDGRTFCDVPPGSYYAASVAWLAANGVTTGITPEVYGSGDPVTRAQMATFLWRLYGSPTPSAPETFVDVPAGVYFTDAVAWLAGTGVTTGIVPGRFAPHQYVNRAQMATFLWRLTGSTTLPGSSPFADVPAGAYFAEAVTWLVDRGVTTGTSPTAFSPGEVVDRAQMAAFLCRLSRTQDYAATGGPVPSC